MEAYTFFSSYFEKHEARFLELYKILLSFQTISSEYKEHIKDFSSCTNWIQNFLEKIGFSVTCYTKDASPPILIAEKRATQPEAKSLLIYNHYDVQPVDPINEWKTPPFEPYVDEKKRVWARGAQDNKGQLLYVLAAMEALTQFYGSNFPLTIRLLIEGQEESGSHFLSELIPQLGTSLEHDYAMIVDMGMESENTPAITFGARGLVALTVTMKGSSSDLHSGVHGGIAYNPLHALTEVLASCRNSKGKITIEGFYDDIVPLQKHEVPQLHQIDEKAWNQENNSLATGGEQDKTITERNWLRPTFEINGIHGGYGGEGTKTVIPKEAFAKITCRLVPNQDPKKIALFVKKALEERTPEGVECQVDISDGMGEAIREDISSILSQKMSEAMKEVWEKEPTYILSGGSIPVLSLLKKSLKGELVLWGVGLSSDCIHAPNEHFDMNRMKLGFLTTCLSIEKLQ